MHTLHYHEHKLHKYDPVSYWHRKGVPGKDMSIVLILFRRGLTVTRLVTVPLPVLQLAPQLRISDLLMSRTSTTYVRCHGEKPSENQLHSRLSITNARWVCLFL